MPLFTIIYGNKKGLKQKISFDFLKYHIDFRIFYSINGKTLKFMNNSIIHTSNLKVAWKFSHKSVL